MRDDARELVALLAFVCFAILPRADPILGQVPRISQSVQAGRGSSCNRAPGGRHHRTGEVRPRTGVAPPDELQSEVAPVPAGSMALRALCLHSAIIDFRVEGTADAPPFQSSARGEIDLQQDHQSTDGHEGTTYRPLDEHH
jgi:hypothetical protein